MPHPRDDLRSTSESIRRDAEQVQALEDEKTSLDLEDPRVDQLSEQIEHVIDDMHGKAAAERELSEDLQ
jgi:hypothetical protein